MSRILVTGASGFVGQTSLGFLVMARRGRLSLATTAVASAIFCGYFTARAQDRPVRAIPCGGEEIARGSISRIVDGRDFVVDGGREVHLAAVEVPLLPPPDHSDAPPGGTAAKAALAILLLGARVVLRRAELASDRYGRLVGYVDAVRGGFARSVQAELVSTGFARVGDDIDSAPCAAELLHRENAAREAKLGLWANPYYAVLRADNPAAILARRDHFVLVDGKVVSVHGSGATIYVNFGRYWSEDFTVTIRKRNERKFAAAGVDLQQLTGRRVVVRGWVGGRRGSGGLDAPWIEATHPEQIELLGLK